MAQNEDVKGIEARLIALLKGREDQFRQALGVQRPWDQWWAIALQHASVNADRLPWSKVSQRDIVGAYLDAAKNGLLVDGQECHVMIRGQKDPKIKCEVCAGGVVRKAGQAGVRLQARRVKEGDFIEIDEGAGTVKHTPAWQLGAEPGKTIGFYAIARYRDGHQVVRTLSLAEVLKRAPKTSGAWDNWEDEMGEKTLVLYIRKVLYFGDEIEGLLASPTMAVGDTWGLNQDAGSTPEAPTHPPQTTRDKVAAAAARTAQDTAAEGPTMPQDAPVGRDGTEEAADCWDAGSEEGATI